jgi:hypothetical protein
MYASVFSRYSGSLGTDDLPPSPQGRDVETNDRKSGKSYFVTELGWALDLSPTETLKEEIGYSYCQFHWFHLCCAGDSKSAPRKWLNTASPMRIKSHYPRQ